MPVAAPLVYGYARHWGVTLAILPIQVVPAPVLRQKARHVTSIDASIKKLINDMTDTLHANYGVGLAAPQVGVPLRVVVIHIPEEDVIVLINPQIVRRKGERTVIEGCLSIPGYRGEIKRSDSVTVKGLNPQGKEIRLKAEDLLCQALEHEIDHLSGILYIDHLESTDKLFPIPQDDESEEDDL